MKKIRSLVYLLSMVVSSLFAEDAIDASDPTKVYTFAGLGIKYTDYTNDEAMVELRTVGNIGITPNDMLLFEIGYGRHNGDKVEGNNKGITNSRLRWFHLFEMDYSISSGYRGWATQIDLQMAGSLKGTDGGNTLSMGVLPAFGINEQWSFFLPLNLVNSWDKDFKDYKGLGVNISPLFVYTPKWWNESYIQIWPEYTYFVSGEFEDQGSAALELTTGGAISDMTWWALTYKKNYDVHLKVLERSNNSGLNNYQNIFLNFTKYF